MGQVIAFPTPTRRVIHPPLRPEPAPARPGSTACERASAEVADVLLALEASCGRVPLIHVLKPLFGPPFVVIRVGARVFQLTPDQARTACAVLMADQAYVGSVSDAFALKDVARDAEALTLHRDRGGRA